MGYPCPVCGDPASEARILCTGCGQELPLRVIVVSEGSQGGGFALVVEDRDRMARQNAGQPTADPDSATRTGSGEDS
jgi:hypothetical protein